MIVFGMEKVLCFFLSTISPPSHIGLGIEKTKPIVGSILICYICTNLKMLQNVVAITLGIFIEDVS